MTRSCQARGTVIFISLLNNNDYSSESGCWLTCKSEACRMEKRLKSWIVHVSHSVAAGSIGSGNEVLPL